jgi:hypothetical protein
VFKIDVELTKDQMEIAKRVKSDLGILPPHWELFLFLNKERFLLFLKEIEYLINHPSVKPDYFAFLRLFIADSEGFEYCKGFNTKLLLSKGYKKEDIRDFLNEKKPPLDDRHNTLFEKTIVALYEPDSFSLDEIEKLNEVGWSQSDIFDSIDHGAFLFKFYKILRAYRR